MTHDLKIHENNSLTSIEDPDRSKTLEVTSSPSEGRKRNNSSSSIISSASDKTDPFAATHNDNTSFIKLLESLRIIVNSQTVPKKSSSIPKPHLPVSLQQDANSILDQLETKAKHLHSNNKQTNPPPKSRSTGQQTETALSILSNSPASQQITPALPLLQRKSPNSSTTYAEVTKKHQASKKPPTLLLYPMKSAEKEEVGEILKREIARPSTKIKDVQKIKNKGVAVQLERDQNVEELIQAINSKETLKSTIETKKPGKTHPSIIIYKLPDETTEDEVQEALAINADIKERLNSIGIGSSSQAGNQVQLTGFSKPQASDIWQKTTLPIGLLAEAVLVTIPLESADHLRWSASIVLCMTISTEQGFLPITTHPTAAAPAIWER
ncbi:hypothetical protein AVEN_196586-1 [Araneus ventricosus]|uniref:Uncharacterized protein n=1 Tax=Araneus ventricosus TaxID=182803 RepID=A0A4Y1ZLT0_ARAVE|nr:hypothetical protein AVEN_196586-1 [Araneus ventricosus]